MTKDNISSKRQLTNDNLRSSISSGAFWSFTKLMSTRLFNILQLILLARILTPEDFGFFAIALMVYGFAEAISYMGFNQALIYMKDFDRNHLNTLFVVNIIRGIILSFLMIVLAVPAGKILNEPSAYIFIFGMAFTPIITSFHNPAMVAFQKNLELKPELFFQLSGVTLSLLISVFIAMFYPSAWALVGGVIAQQLGQLFASYYLHPFRPQFKFKKKSFDPMMNFGKWIIISQSLKYFVSNIPTWTIGSQIGVQALGLYRVSGRISESLGRDFSKMITSVAFPSFSFLQDSKNKLGEIYYASQRLVGSVSFLIFGLLISMPDRFVYVLLGEKWAEAIEIIFLLSILSLIQNIGSQVEVIKASGNTKFLTMIVFIRVTLISLFIYPAVHFFGINGAIYVIIVSAIITFPISMIKVCSFTQTAPKKLIKIYCPPLISIIIMMTVSNILDNLFISKFGLISSQGLFLFLVMILLASLTYLVSLFIFDKFLRTGIYTEIFNLVSERLK